MQFWSCHILVSNTVVCIVSNPLERKLAKRTSVQCALETLLSFSDPKKKNMVTNISTWQPNVKSPIFNQSPVRIHERINECYSICVILYLAVFAIFGFLCVSDDLVLSRCSWIFFWHNLIFFSRLKAICFCFIYVDWIRSFWNDWTPLFHDPNSNPFRLPFFHFYLTFSNSFISWPSFESFQISFFHSFSNSLIFLIVINNETIMDGHSTMPKIYGKYFLLVFQNIGTLFGPNSMTHPESISINMLNAPGDSTVQCDCGHINCPLCNLMMNLELTDPTRLM